MTTGLQTLDIFTLLGVEGSEEDKESFLMELQDVIWEEVVNDQLGDDITEADVQRIEAVVNDGSLTSEQKRDQMYSLLEEKVENLSEVLAEKTSEIKAELFAERLAGLRERYSRENKTSQLQVLGEVERLAQSGEYLPAVEMLNKMTAVEAPTTDSDDVDDISEDLEALTAV